ncbi:MAG: hypothetical protein JG766_2503 [Desulfacinum sp.]|jgi:REP element-mobilizing transposase RayT|nr:hypothetical protein [Desulfacinum sp.]
MEATDPNSGIPFEQMGMRTSDHTRHRRRPMRLPGYDYSRPGAYFVTLCTHRKIPLFGRVEDGRMVLNAAGRVAERCWLDIPGHFPQVRLDQYVVMPNHLHGILWIVRGTRAQREPVGANNHSPLQGNGMSRARGTSKTVGSVVRGFKIGVTKWFRQNTNIRTVWQRNYYEHVIRNDQSLQQIREYIRDNPIRWDLDPENPNALSKVGKEKVQGMGEDDFPGDHFR